MGSNTTKAEPRKRRPRKITAERLRTIGNSYLDRYEASTASYRAMLERRVWKAAKAHDQDPKEFVPLVEEEVRRAQNAGYLDDARYAKNQVHSQRTRGASARMISAKLAAKGIGRDVIEAVMGNDDVDDRSAAIRLAQRRRLGPYRPRERAERRERDIAALCRAGFSFSIAQAVIDGERDA